MKLGTTVMRRLGTAAGLTLAAGMLAACGSDGSGDAPDDATVEEFCDSINPSKAFEDVDIAPDASEDEQKEAVEEALQNWRDELGDTGTPEDISDEARDGYEEILEQFDEIDFDQSLEEIGEQFEELDDASDEVKALEDYVEEECDIAM